jgi:hypothetical protein
MLVAPLFPVVRKALIELAELELRLNNGSLTSGP